METLGKTLKSTRENVSQTLRDVEIATGISNAYLSQLENDKIKKPSASILYKLADAYKIDLNVLLQAAGIIEKKNIHESSQESFFEKQIQFYKDKLTDEEAREVLDFIKFLRYKKSNESTL